MGKNTCDCRIPIVVNVDVNPSHFEDFRFLAASRSWAQWIDGNVNVLALNIHGTKPTLESGRTHDRGPDDSLRPRTVFVLGPFHVDSNDIVSVEEVFDVLPGGDSFRRQRHPRQPPAKNSREQPAVEQNISLRV